MSLLSRIGAAYDAIASPAAPASLGIAAVANETPLSQPAPWLTHAFGGASSAAGKIVTPESAMRISVVYACVSVLSRSIGQTPCILMKRTAEGAVPAVDHPLYPLLLNMPNPEMTAQDSTELGMNHLLLRGNAYTQIVRDQGQVVELNPLHPDHVRMFRDTQNRLWYKYTPPWGGERDFPARDIWRQIGMTFNGLQGVSPLTYAREAMGLSLAQEEHGAKLFANGAQVATALETPNKLSEPAYDRLKASFADEYGGSRNAFKSIILEEGLKVSKLALSSVDAEFLESRKFQVEEICRFYSTPPHKVQDMSRATFNNIEHLSLDFVNTSLMPWYVRREQSIYRDLLLPGERKKYFCRHDLRALERGDMQATANYLASLVANTFISPNEGREYLGYNRREGGDKYENPNTSTGKEKPGAQVPDTAKG